MHENLKEPLIDIISKMGHKTYTNIYDGGGIGMADSYEKIITELKKFMDDHPSGFWGSWYVGITEDADSRLRRHNALGVPHKVMTATSPKNRRAGFHGLCPWVST